jgi:hypothetical protein
MCASWWQMATEGTWPSLGLPPVLQRSSCPSLPARHCCSKYTLDAPRGPAPLRKANRAEHRSFPGRPRVLYSSQTRLPAALARTAHLLVGDLALGRRETVPPASAGSLPRPHVRHAELGGHVRGLWPVLAVVFAQHFLEAPHSAAFASASASASASAASILDPRAALRDCGARGPARPCGRRRRRDRYVGTDERGARGRAAGPSSWAAPAKSLRVVPRRRRHGGGPLGGVGGIRFRV